MKVEVRVFATLRKYVPELKLGEPKIIDLPEGMTIRELRDWLELPPEEVRIIMRNGRHTGLDELIADGDRIAYIPAVGGG